jgi:NADH-quinone oxidoreductase subunit J
MPLFYTFHFYLFGLIAIASAVAFVTRKSPVAAALWLVAVMFSLAALYVMLDAHFIAAVQVLVYAGAIMVVFLFVVMLLNLGQASEESDFRPAWGRLAAGAAGVVMAALLLTTLRARLPEVPPAAEPPANAVAPVAENLFTDNLVAFEVTSVLLLVAIVGAVVLARRGGVAGVPRQAAGGPAAGGVTSAIESAREVERGQEVSA